MNFVLTSILVLIIIATPLINRKLIFRASLLIICGWLTVELVSEFSSENQDPDAVFVVGTFIKSVVVGSIGYIFMRLIYSLNCLVKKAYNKKINRDT